MLATGYRRAGAGVPRRRSATGSAGTTSGRFAVLADYAVDHDGREIFVQNAEEHTHGFVAPDLGMGAYRNSVIIAAMIGREVYPIEKQIAVQSFGVPDHLTEVGPMRPTLEPLDLDRDLAPACTPG